VRILVDLDSTVADLLNPWLALYNAEHGDDLTIDRLTSFDTHTIARAGTAIYDVLKRDGLFRSLPPLPGALEGVEALRAAGNEVFVVTAAEFPTNCSEKIAWLGEHLPFIDKRHRIIAHEKHLLSGDVLIDDGPHNAVAYKKAHPAAFITGIKFPYNAECEAFTYLADDWRDTARAWRTMVDVLTYAGRK
jgi:5'-nucleotidase